MELKNDEYVSFYDDGIVCFNAKQCDTARKFNLIISNDEIMNGVTSAELVVESPDHRVLRVVDYGTVITKNDENNGFIIDTSVGVGQSILNNAGKNECELVLYDAAQHALSTYVFYISIAPSKRLSTEPEAVTENYLTILNGLVVKAKSEADRAVAEADRSKSWYDAATNVMSLHFKGEYSTSTRYVSFDVVYLDRMTFICKQPNTGNAPNPDADTDYWQRFYERITDAEIEEMFNS